MMLNLVAVLALAPAARLNVVTTTPDLASIASAVGGDKVSASSLIVGARDPHRLEAKPSFMSRVAKADLFIAVGLQLEIGYEGLILSGSRNSKVQVGAKGHLYGYEGGVRILEKPSGSVSRAEGDIHPDGNPHYWLDPYNAKAIARAISTKLAQLNPGNATYFKQREDAFENNIDQKMFGSALVQQFGGDKLWAWDNQGKLMENLRGNGAAGKLGGWAGKLAPYRGQPIITYHRSWSYFVNRFDLNVIAELEPKPGLEPTPGHVREVLTEASREKARVILQEPFYSDKDAKFVASRIGGRVVVVPNSVGQVAGAKDYFGLMDTIVSEVADAYGAR